MAVMQFADFEIGNFLWIIFVVIYFIYSIYSQVKGGDKPKKVPQRRMTHDHIPQGDPMEEYKPRQRPRIEHVQEYEALDSYRPEIISLEETENFKPKKIPAKNKLRALEDELKPAEVEEIRNDIMEDFDPRKAIIWGEIMNKRY